jgi:hypothetical protein
LRSFIEPVDVEQIVNEINEANNNQRSSTRPVTSTKPENNHEIQI